MKIYKSISIAATLGLALSAGLTSCVDLKQEPLSFYTMENFKPDAASFESLANGLFLNFAYGGVGGQNYGFNCRVMSMCLGADDVVDGKKNITRLSYLDQLDVRDYSGNDISYMWGSMYRAVQASSSLAKNILAKELPSTVIQEIYGNDTLRMEEQFDAAECKKLIDAGWLKEGKKPDIRTFLGEAYFVRALSYFYLVRFWGDVPCFANHLNTKSIDGTPAISQQIPRTPFKAIYEKMILRDLMLAIELLPANSRTENNSNPSIWTAKTLLADVYLNMAGYPLKDPKRYTDCYKVCEDIITNGPYNLTSKYEDLWKQNKTTDNTEHIFSIIHINKNGFFSNYGMSYYATEENVGGEGWSDILMDPVFYESYPKDERLKMVAITKFENEYTKEGKKFIQQLDYWKSSKKAPALGKYRNYNRDGNKFSPQSLGITPIYRYAEVLLMYAESYVKAGNAPNALAIKSLRDVRTRAAHPDPVPDNFKNDEFLDLVFDEYGWEFVGEGKRWFQLLRTEKLIKQVQKNKAVLIRQTSEAAAQNGKGYRMPIFSTAIEEAKNVGVIITQNPGY